MMYDTLTFITIFSIISPIFYSNLPITCRIKVVKSLVKSDHLGIVLSDADDAVATFIKTKKTVTFRDKSPSEVATFLGNANQISFDLVLDNNDNVQECADTFYRTLTDLFSSSFPLKQCTISNCDPSSITPEIKSLLRKKNLYMHQNKIELASALSTKIGKLISRNNSSRLANINAGGSSMWDEVKKLTSSSRPTSPPLSISADSLNQYYSSISSDRCILLL